MLPALAARLAELSADELADALWFMEVQLLDMQKQIFDDMAVQHYANQVGGLELIDAFARATADPRLPLEDQVAYTREPTPDIPGVETPPVRLGGPGGPTVVWNPPDIPGLQIPDLPSFETPDVHLDIDGIDPSANVANEVDRMKWIEEVVNAMVIDRWHNDPDGLLSQTQLDLPTEVEKYRQIPPVARP